METINGDTNQNSEGSARKGFNSSDFLSSQEMETNEYVVPIDTREDSYTDSSGSDEPVKFRDRIYRLLELTWITIAMHIVIFVDFIFLFAFFALLLRNHQPYGFTVASYVVDWSVTTVYVLEVNSRLYAFGPQFYMCDPLRCAEYLMSTTNAVLVCFTLFIPGRWLFIARMIRAFRGIASMLKWMESHMKWKARRELLILGQLLEMERSEWSKLTKWRLSPTDVAVGEQVGFGGFGSVYSALFRGTLVAVKQVSVQERNKSFSMSIEYEAITLVNLRHPNIVLFMGFVHQPLTLWIVTEYCSRGSLQDILDIDKHHLLRGKLLKLALGAARGLAYLHGQSPPVLHLDLKPSNILISSGWDAKLADFGLSRKIDDLKNDKFAGTVQYAAPEVLASNTFSTACDIYSFGICLWELAAGENAFQRASPLSILWDVVKGGKRPPLEAIRVKSTKAAGTEGGELQGVRVSAKEDPQPKLAIAHTLQSTQGQAPVTSPVSSGDTGAVRAPGCEADDSVSEKGGPVDGTTVESSRSLTYEEREMVRRVTNNRSFQDCVSRSSGLAATGGARNEGAHEKAMTSLQRLPGRKESGAIRTVDTRVKIDDLRRRVTATIQKFDDRPPGIRPLYGTGNLDGNGNGNGQGQGEGSVGDVGLRVAGEEGHLKSKISFRLKNTFRSRNSSRNSSRNGGGSRNSNFGSDQASPDVGGNNRAFERRLKTFSANGKSYLVGDGEQKGEEGSTRSIISSRSRTGNVIVSTSTSRAKVEVGSGYVELIQKCWAQNASERPSCSQLVWRLVFLIDEEMRSRKP